MWFDTAHTLTHKGAHTRTMPNFYTALHTTMSSQGVMNLGYKNAVLSKKKGFSGFKLERHRLSMRLFGARSALTSYVYNMMIGNALLATTQTNRYVR